MRSCILFLGVMLSFCAHAGEQIVIDAGNVGGQVDCFSESFSSYDSWKAKLEGKWAKAKLSAEKLKVIKERFSRIFPRSDYERYRQTIACNNFYYKTDDDVYVYGYVIKPKVVDKSLPVLIYNRGGNGNYGAVNFSNMVRSLFPLAEKGYVIVGSQYRGTLSEVKEGEPDDEFGGHDIKDVQALFDIIPTIKGADENRIGMYGHSRGVMETYITARSGVPVKSIVAAAGCADLLHELAFRPEMENVYKLRIPDYAQNKEAELRKRSVLYWADELAPDVPILLLHGELDKRISVAQSRQLAAKLEELHHPHTLVIYPDDDHSFNKHYDEFLAQIDQWFKKTL